MLVPFLEKYSMAFPARCWPWSPQAVYWYQSPRAWPHLPWLEKCWPSSNPWKDQNYDNCLLQYTAVCISGIVVISKCQLDKVFFFEATQFVSTHLCKMLFTWIYFKAESICWKIIRISLSSISFSSLDKYWARVLQLQEHCSWSN